MSQFTNVAVCLDPEITVSYRSGKMVYEEGLRDGKWVSLSYSASGHLMAANPIPKPPFMKLDNVALPQAFRINTDGQDLLSHWQWGGIDVQESGEKINACVTLNHAVRPVTVRIHTELDGTQVLKRSIEVVNTSDKPMALASLSPMSGPLQQTSYGAHRADVSGDLYRIGYMKHSIWGMEGDFHWENLPDEIFTITGRMQRNRHRHPMFLLENRATGETFIAQFAWTGGYAFSFDFNRENPGIATLSMNVSIDAPAPLRMLEAGSSYTSPAVHLGVVFGGLDPAVQEMHTHIRRSVLLPPTRGVTGWIEGGIGPEYNMDIASTLKSLEHAHGMGVEIFFIDAGWYLEPYREDDWWKYCGDWRYNTNRYPNGIEEVREAAHAKGMLFGMWMDADRIGDASKVWKEHEDWRATNYNGKRTMSGLLNLADKEVAAWMEKEIRFLLDEYKLDMFRLDHNVSHLDSLAYNERDGYLENTYVRYYENLYDIYSRLRKDYPNVIFENCAGGGGRSDIGMTANFTHTWVTDWQIHPRAFSITNGMTMALTPECVDRLIGGQNAYLAADVATQIRNLIFARPTIGVIKPTYAEENPEQAEIIRHHVKIYKEFVRPMHQDSLFFHHTPDLSKALDGFGILEMAKSDKSQGMIGVFRLAEPEKEEVVVYPRGIDPAKNYLVTYDNLSAGAYKISGAELYRDGLRVRLGSSLTSELILYRAE